MKKFLTLAAGVAASISAPAMAAPTVTIDFLGASGAFSNPAVFCGTSGSVANGSGGTNSWVAGAMVGGSCSFTDTLTFLSPAGYAIEGGSITTNTATGATGTVDDINFSSVTLNGIAFTLGSLNRGAFEFGAVSGVTAAAPPALNTLVITGVTRGTGAVTQLGGLDAGSYGGQITFAAPVPEPATWLSMIAGFGMLGFALRRQTKVRVNFA